MNLQESIDYAVSKIVEQGGQCMAENGNCKYKYGEKRCVVGWILTDEKSLQCSGPVKEIVFHYKTPSIISENIELWSILQSFHDGGTQNIREHHLTRLITKFPDIDFTKPHFQEWINL